MAAAVSWPLLISTFTVLVHHSSGNSFPHKCAICRKSRWNSESLKRWIPTFLGRKRKNPAYGKSPSTAIPLLKSRHTNEFKTIFFWKVLSNYCWQFLGSIWLGFFLVNKRFMLSPVRAHHWSASPENPEGWPAFWSTAGSQLRGSLWALSEHCPGSPTRQNGTCGTNCWDFLGWSWCCFVDFEVPFVFPTEWKNAMKDTHPIQGKYPLYSTMVLFGNWCCWNPLCNVCIIVGFFFFFFSVCNRSVDSCRILPSSPWEQLQIVLKGIRIWVMV